MASLSVLRVYYGGRRTSSALVALCSLSRGGSRGFEVGGRRWQRSIHLCSCRFSSEAAAASVPASILSATAKNSSSEPFETSAKAKWAADAVQMPSEETVMATTPSDILNSLPPQGDFASLGLGGHSPVGLIQSSLEWLHVQVGLPWWASIIISTVVLRSLLFPLGVKMQINAAKLNNIRPQTEEIMTKMKEYQQMGNTMMAGQYSAQLMMLYKQHDCSPFKMMIMPFVQFPIFISFFLALRQMAALPVESMKMGGLFWFTDLTVPDPFYILPVASCFAFLLNIELGGEVGVGNPQVEKMKTFFRIMAFLMIPITATFPSGLFMYWLTSSFFSLGQVLLLKVPSFRSTFGIPTIIHHPTTTPTLFPSIATTAKKSSAAASEKESEGIMKQVMKNFKQGYLIAEAKQKDDNAKKRYKKQLSQKTPKLYDKPPHKRG